ncbi:GroES-like protein [Periconia macrospinosa]|uniref:GroES-like protein n=1 Tax=Periconia macrospinosa TaxID=97972 RepID=A0A2V1D6G0_9PLEO|nr:GroES-like protein [Periconia macrospinosa]
MANQASVIPAATAKVELQDVEKYTPGPNEVLVKVHSIGFSPIEAKVQRFATHPIPYPNILGSSFAGIIESLGPDVKDLQVGDRIVTIRSPKALGDPKFGAYQKYALASASSISKLDPSTPFHAASAAILNTAAIVCALTIHLGLDRPDLTSSSPSPANKNKKILIYGGSSSSGGLSVRFLAHARYTVITTSSPAHHDFVKSLGAAEIIDHRQPTAEIIKALQSHGPYDAVFDTIGTPAATDAVVGYLETLGSAPVSYNTLIPPLPGTRESPANVERKFAPYSFALEEPAHAELKKWMLEVYVPQGLKTGVLVPTRQEVLTGGLGSVQKALDDMIEDRVSGKKLVLDPWA